MQPTNPGLSFNHHAAAMHRAFHRANVALDVIGPDAALEGYRLVVAPLLMVVGTADVARLDAFVRGGGTLLLTFRAGSRDEYDAIVDARLPGLLRDLCGIEVDEYDSLPPRATRRLRFVERGLRGASGLYPASWCDALRLRGARALALYADGHLGGKPAITLHRRGEGRVVYLGTASDQPLYDALVPWLCGQAGVRPVLRTPPGVEAAERERDGRRLLFLLNHGGTPRRVRLPRSRFTDLLAEGRPGPRMVGGSVVLPPHGVRLLEAGTQERATSR